MVFEFQNRLWLLLLIIPLTGLFLLYFQHRYRILKKYFSDSNFPLVFPQFSKNKPMTKFILYGLAFCLGIIALANPMEKNEKEKSQKTLGSDIVFVVDISNSMRCEDIKPNRLKRSQQIIYSITDQLNSDRLGLVLFAGEAYQLLPMTIDHAAFKMFVGDMSPEMIQPQGTAIGNALQVAFDALQRSKSQKPLVVLLSDGENFDEIPSEVLAQYQKNKIPIHSIAVGSAIGAPVPVYDQGKKVGQKKDEEGKLIISRPDEKFLQQLSDASQGVFVSMTDLNNAPDIIAKALQTAAKTENNGFSTQQYHSIYHWFLFPALFILLLDLLIVERRMSWQNRLKAFIERRKL